jgi:hypothetical protein
MPIQWSNRYRGGLAATDSVDLSEFIDDEVAAECVATKMIPVDSTDMVPSHTTAMALADATAMASTDSTAMIPADTTDTLYTAMVPADTTDMAPLDSTGCSTCWGRRNDPLHFYLLNFFPFLLSFLASKVLRKEKSIMQLLPPTPHTKTSLKE